MPNDKNKPAAAAAFDATVDRNAEIVKRGRKRKPFLERLGLSLPVTPKDVKQAYFAKAKLAHPDHGGESAEFRALQEAFEEALKFAERNRKRLPWIGLQMPMYVSQREILKLVEKWGGEVEVQKLDWLEGTVGADFTAIADRLVEINLSGKPIDDAQLMQLAEQEDGLKYLEVLRLANTQVGDDGIAKVAGVSNLRYLDLRGTHVSRGMRKQLAALPMMHRVEGSGGWRDWLPWG